MLRLAALAQREPELRDWILKRQASELVTAVPADGIWVRIIKDGKAVFAGTFKPDNGNATFTAVLPDEGRYDVTARFIRNDTTIENTFAVTAGPRGAGAVSAAAQSFWPHQWMLVTGMGPMQRKSSAG